MSKVNHPKHYKKKDRDECIVEMAERYGVANTAIFSLMSAYKYLYRAGDKKGSAYEEDINKAKWYLQYVQDLNAPIIDMNYWKLKTDIERMIKQEENKNGRKTGRID